MLFLRFTLILIITFFFTSGTWAQIAPEANPQRGIYADMFYKRLPSGELDPSVSILAVDTNRDGIFEVEDAFLTYCAENHFTYITLYDLQQIFGRFRTAWNENTRKWEDMEQHLCRFIKKAKEEYCIEKIGGASGGKSGVDSILSFNDRYPETANYRLRQEQLNSPAFDPRLRIAEQSFPKGSNEQVLSEFVKFYLRMTDLNSCGDCGASFDVLNTEVEFWGACPTDFPIYADMAQYMYSVKQLHNNLHPTQPVITEAYVANLYYCTSPYSMTDVVHLLDGCKNCAPCPTCTAPHQRLFDRILYAYLTPNAAYFIHHALEIFNDSITADSTDYHPLLYSESGDLGGLVNYLGAWFPQWFTNNIFLAEMSMYSSWRNHTYTNVNLARENNVQPGGVQWFARKYMVDPLADPMIFYSTGPRCAGSGPSTVNFTYNGPPEIGSEYSFWVSRNSDSAIVYPASGVPYTGFTDSYLPVIGPNPGRRSIEFSDTSIFAPCILLNGEYTAHLKLGYEWGEACDYQYDQALLISDKPGLTVWGDTSFCEGHFTWLRATGGSAYQWYKDNSPIPAAVALTYKVTKAGNYFCTVAGGGAACSGNTDTVFINVKPNPMATINKHCSSSSATFIANAFDTLSAPKVYGEGGVTYQWSSGETTDRITVSYTGTTYRLVVTDPYSGCTRFTDTKAPSNPSKTYTVSIDTLNSPSGACIPDGTLFCKYTPAHSQPVKYLWNTGESTYNLQYVYPGNYSVITTVYDNSCSYFAQYTLGPLPTTGPTIAENIIPVSCHGSSNGQIQVTLSGGNPPFRFYWENLPFDLLHDPLSKNQSNLFPGAYTLNIYDANGCRFQRHYVVPVTNSKISMAINSVSPVTLCSTNSDGAASVTAGGGTGPYQYQWNDPLQQSGSSVSNLPSGTWRVTAIDQNGCEAVSMVSIPSSPPIFFNSCDTSITWLDCPQDSTGLLIYCVQGGTQPYSVAPPWTMPDSVHIMLTNIPVGNYTANLTDANGCTASVTTGITSPAEIIFTNCDSLVTMLACSGDSTGLLIYCIQGGNPPYTVSSPWIMPDLTHIRLSDLPAGNYTANVTDANGCQSSITTSITAPPTFNVSTTVAHTTCIGCSNGIINISANGGVSPYSISIDPPSGIVTDSSIELLSAGIYHVCIVDSSSCTICVSDTVLEDPTDVKYMSNSSVSMLIFPNPSNKGAVLKVSGIRNGLPVQLSILDVSGRIVSEQIIFNSEHHELPDNFSEGIYFVTIKIDDDPIVLPWFKWFITTVD